MGLEIDRMTEKRFTLDETFMITDNECMEIINPLMNSKDVAKVYELLNGLHEENQALKQQLLYDGDDVCSICKHEYLTPSGDYFIGKCKKGHKECSKEDIKYCEDFEKELEE